MASALLPESYRASEFPFTYRKGCVLKIQYSDYKSGTQKEVSRAIAILEPFSLLSNQAGKASQVFGFHGIGFAENGSAQTSLFFGSTKDQSLGQLIFLSASPNVLFSSIHPAYSIELIPPSDVISKSDREVIRTFITPYLISPLTDIVLKYVGFLAPKEEAMGPLPERCTTKLCELTNSNAFQKQTLRELQEENDF